MQLVDLYGCNLPGAVIREDSLEGGSRHFSEAG